MYRCDICGVVFDEPFTQQKLENLDGENGWERQFIRVCPICGSTYFNETEDTEDER